jgi:MtrB/PioB family decaheme-associated outer membrane protein
MLFAIGAQGQTLPPRPDTSEWKCEQCPKPEAYEADYSLGGTYVSDDSARFGNATGYDEEGGYVFAEGSGRRTTDSHFMSWDLVDLGTDARALEFEGGNPGAYQYHVGYSELPYRRFDDTQTIYRQAGNEDLVLPEGWVGAGSTSGMSALDASLADRDIQSDRTTYEIGAHYAGANPWQFAANYRRTQRDGWEIVGASFYTNAALLPAPFDDSTDQVDLTVSYQQERWFLQLGWSGSSYDNSNQAWRWENAFFAGAGATLGQIAQSPDNQAQALTLSGAYYFPARTTVSLSAEIGEMRQDEAFLPYSIDPNLAGTLPRESFDGQVDTTNYDVQIVSSPWDFLRLSAFYRYQERDNKSPVSLWSRTIVDMFPTNDMEANRPYSFERARFGASASARFDWFEWLEAFRFEGGYERIEMDRSLQEVPEQTEDTGWGRVVWRAGGWPEISLRAGASSREIAGYDPQLATAYEQNPLMRKYNLAYRYRDFVELRALLDLGSLPLAIGAEAYYATDDYTESTLGLRNCDDRRFAADLTWTISERSVAFLEAGYEELELDTVNSESFDGPDWRSMHQDRFRTVGAGVNVEGLWSERFGMRLNLTYAQGESDIDVAASLSTSGSFPRLETEMTSVDLDLSYRLTDAMDVRLRLRYEDYSSSDWALENVEPATIPQVLTLGADPYDYDVYLATIAIRYYFGRAAARAPGEESSKPTE